MPLELPEPSKRCERQFQPPDDEGADKDGKAVQAIPGRFGGAAIRVAVDAQRGNDNMQDQQDREDRSWRKRGGDCQLASDMGGLGSSSDPVGRTVYEQPCLAQGNAWRIAARRRR